MRGAYKGVTAFFLCLLLSLGTFAASPETLIPGGNTVGLSLRTHGVSIVEFTKKEPKEAGLEKGDVIQKIDGQTVREAQDVTEAVSRAQGRPLELSVLRKNEEKTYTLAPCKEEEGWQLGLMVRDHLNGIGTVTYYNQADDSFGALGHGVNEGNGLLPLEEGSVLPARVASVVKGKKGEPGALQGVLSGRTELGQILRNTPQGVFGTMDCPEKNALPVAEEGEVREGAATILSNIRGTEVKEYTVEITELNMNDSLNRNFLLKVTDPELLKATGGIVQGMSGSPIIQDGKLVGAVTHVLVNDPTTGYGIFIENMLDAAA